MEPLDKQLQSRDAPALNLHSGHGPRVNDAFCTEDIRAVCLPRDAFTSFTPLQKGQPLCGVPGCAVGEQPMGHPKSLHSPHSYTSPANIFTHGVWLKKELPQASQSSIQISLFAVSKQEWMKTVLRMARVRWDEMGWGPGSFKTGSSAKDIASLPHCLHPYCRSANSKVSFQNSISKMKSIRFISLNVSIFLCCFSLELRSCCDPQWNHRDTSCWMGFRFAILSGKKRREQWRKDNSYIYRQAFKTAVYQLKVIDTWGDVDLPSSLKQKHPEKFSCGSSTCCWLCSCAMEAQLGEVRGLVRIWALLFFLFSVVSVILRHLQINTRQKQRVISLG